MKTSGILFAGALAAALTGGITAASAHTAQQCVKELQQYSAVCKFSPSMFILGFCKNKKAQEWCKDRKMHEEKFHKD